MLTICIKIPNCDPGSRKRLLNEFEIKIFRRYIGQLSWRSSMIRPDFDCIAMLLTNISHKAKIADLKKTNRIIHIINSRMSSVSYSFVGAPKDLMILGVNDAHSSPAVRPKAGYIVMLASKLSNSIAALSVRGLSSYKSM